MLPLKYFPRHRPYEYQEKGLRRALKRDGGYAFFFHPGLGKTKPTIDFAGIKFLEGKLNRVLIAGPLSSIGVWEEEIAEHLPGYIPRQVIRLDVTNKKKAVQSIPFKSSQLVFVVGTYDTITTYVKTLSKWIRGGLVVPDEIHMIKNPNTKRSRAMHSLRSVARWRIGCTGTPSAKNYLGIYSIFKFVDDSLFGTRYKAFKDKYIIYGGYMGYEIRGYRNLKTMSKKMRKASLRVKKEKAKGLPTELPPSIVPIRMSGKERKAYEKMAEEMVVELDDGTIASSEMAVTRILRLQQITSGFVKNEEGEIVNLGKSKIQVLVSLLETYKEAGEKVVIFCRFKRDIKAIAKSLGKDVLVLQGNLSGKRRDAIRNEFRIRGGYVPLVCQIGTGVSISLDSASTAIYFSMDFVTENYIQSKARIVRRNTKGSHVHYIYLVAENTVDVGIYRLLQSNIDLSTLLLDDFKKLVNGELKIKKVKIT